MEKGLVRKATYAGSWYSSEKESLRKELQKNLSEVEKFNLEKGSKLKGVIVPHAGYRFSGPTAAWSYENINKNKTNIKRVFILGPSHHNPFEGAGLTKADFLETPFGNLKVNREITNDLVKEKHFHELALNIDEREHSLELQFPYLWLVFEKQAVEFIPIMIGRNDRNKIKDIANSLSQYYLDEENLFVISSDFCHWGMRFGFMYHEKEKFKNIYESIEYLDKKGIELIESQNCENFMDYLLEYKNTICGRMPISVFLSIIELGNKSKLKTKFTLVKYAQSSQVTDKTDSSVSYAAMLNYTLE